MLTPLLIALAPSFAADDLADVISQKELDALVAEISAEIEVLRETKFKHPVGASVTDREGFLAYAKQELEEESTPEDLAADEAVAKLLGTIPPQMDLLGTSLALLEEQVGGFYDPSTDEFTLMASFTGGLAKIILAHELTHALDDQYHDLDATMEALESNDDAGFAYHAVVEGSATTLMNQWTMQHMGELSMEELMSGGDMGMDALQEAPPILWKPLLGMYLKGAAFLNRTESVMKGSSRVPSLEDVQYAFAAPPLSSEQVLHPDKYWDEDERDDPIGIAFDLERLPEWWSVLEENTLGELGLAMVVEPLKKRKGPRGQLAILGTRYTTPATEGWGGDRYLLLGRGDARVLFSISVWDTDDDEQEFVAAATKLEAHLAASARGFAAAGALEGAGHDLHRSPRGYVRFTSWIGISDEEATTLAASLEEMVGEFRR